MTGSIAPVTRLPRPTATVAPAAQSLRLPGFDWLRMFAAYGVVWIHCFDMHPTARYIAGKFGFAVPCFVTMAFMLLVGHAGARPDSGAGTMVWRRCKRLVPAYLAWSGIYLAARFAKHVWLHSGPPQIDWLAVLLMGGASYQLYFLPAMLLWTIVVALGWGLLRNSAQPLALGATLVFAGALAAFGAQQWTPPDVPFLHHLRGLSAYVLFGLGGGLVLLRAARLRPSSAWASLVGIGVAVALMFFPWNVSQATSTGIAAVANLLLVWSFAAAPASWMRPAVRRLSECAFGVYLCHGLFVEGGQVALSRIGVNSPSLATVSLFTVAVYVASLAVTMALARSPRTRWLVA